MTRRARRMWTGAAAIFGAGTALLFGAGPAAAADPAAAPKTAPAAPKATHKVAPLPPLRTAGPAAPASPVAPGPLPTTPTVQAPVPAPIVSTDPAVMQLSVAQATAGIKGKGALTATFELTHENKPFGVLRCELFAEQAPLAVANFVGLARGLRPFKDPRSGQWVKKPLFDGNFFHRIIPGFMIQTGDPQCLSDTNCMGRPSGGDPGYSYPDEFRAELRFDKPGVLSVASRSTGINGSQIFITEKEAPWLTGFHTIFGQCGELALVGQIASQPTLTRDLPKSPVFIKKLTIAHAQK